VDEKVNAFKSFTEEIRRNLPDILLAAMISLHQNYKEVKAGGGGAAPGRKATEDGGKETILNLLRTQAKAMITFAGMLPYRLPGDTSARLVQLEVLMN
jgi:nuclear pore complex protein Nup93